MQEAMRCNVLICVDCVVDNSHGERDRAVEYPVFDVIAHSFFEPMSYRIGVK